MKKYLILIIAFLLAANSLVANEDTITVTSAKEAFTDQGYIYVSAGSPSNHVDFQPQLEELWQLAAEDIRIDNFGQPWREVTLAALEQIFGPADRDYLVAFNNEVMHHSATTAFLFRWGCDYSVIPVIGLGKHRFSVDPENRNFDALGIAATINLDTAKIIIGEIDKTLIPPDFFMPSSSPSGWGIWINEKKRFSYIKRNHNHEVDQKNIILDHEKNEQQTIIGKSIVDVRC